MTNHWVIGPVRGRPDTLHWALVWHILKQDEHERFLGQPVRHSGGQDISFMVLQGQYLEITRWEVVGRV